MKLKFKKYPKKPKTTASVAVKERFIEKCKQIDAENRAIAADYKKGKDLDKKISGFVGTWKDKGKTTVYYTNKRSKPKTKVSGTKKKAAKKSSKRRR